MCCCQVFVDQIGVLVIEIPSFIGFETIRVISSCLGIYQINNLKLAVKWIVGRKQHFLTPFLHWSRDMDNWWIV